MNKAPAILKHDRGSLYGEHDWRQDKTCVDQNKVKAKQRYESSPFWDNLKSEQLEENRKEVDARLVEERSVTKITVRSKHAADRVQRGGGRCSVGTTDSGKRPTFISKEEEEKRWNEAFPQE